MRWMHKPGREAGNVRSKVRSASPSPCSRGTLHAHAVDVLTRDSAAARSGANPSLRILVAEDEPSIRELNAAWLTDSGYRVDAAADGLAAWEALRDKRYHLLVTDNKMPRLSGMDLVVKIRAACMSLPVIMATGAVTPEELVQQRQLKVAATLLKPFGNDQLLAVVQTVLGMVPIAAQRAP